MAGRERVHHDEERRPLAVLSLLWKWASRAVIALFVGIIGFVALIVRMALWRIKPHEYGKHWRLWATGTLRVFRMGAVKAQESIMLQYSMNKQQRKAYERKQSRQKTRNRRKRKAA